MGQGDESASRIDLYHMSLNEYVKGRVAAVRELLKQSGEKGTRLERLVEDIIRDFLPGRYSLRTGFLMDHLGNLSPQIDIIITDEYVHPRLFTTLLPALHPADCALATIEVKTTLNEPKLKEAMKNIKTTRQCLKLIHEGGRKVLPPGPGLVYVESAQKVIPEPIGIIVAYESDAPETLMDNIMRICDEESIENRYRFDLLFVLSTGDIIGWIPQGGTQQLFVRPAEDRTNEARLIPVHTPPMASPDESDLTPAPAGRALAFFMMLLYRFIQNMILPSTDAVLRFYTSNAYFDWRPWKAATED